MNIVEMNEILSRLEYYGGGDIKPRCGQVRAAWECKYHGEWKQYSNDHRECDRH